MGTVALSNRTQLFVSSHLLLAANACSASLSPQSLTQRPKPTVSVLAHSSPAKPPLMGTVASEQPHPALRQLASPTRGQRMLCESQPPVSYAEAKTHRLNARALVSCSAARRRNDSAAATNGPFLLPPTNPHRPFISSPPPPDIVSLLTPGASPHASKYAALLRRLILRLLATLFIHLPH